jgi:glutathione S-transferase
VGWSLERRYEPGLAERARCRQLEAAADEIVFPPVWALIDGAFYPTPAGSAAAERVPAAREALAGLHRDLDRELRGRGWLCDRSSVADIGTFIMVSTGATLGAPPAAGHADLLAWLARVAGRPAVKHELEAMTVFAVSAKRSGPQRPEA